LEKLTVDKLELPRFVADFKHILSQQLHYSGPFGVSLAGQCNSLERNFIIAKPKKKEFFATMQEIIPEPKSALVLTQLPILTHESHQKYMDFVLVNY